MSSTLPAIEPSLARRAEPGVRVVLRAFSIAAVLALICHLALIVWARNAFSGPESVVSAHALMLARDGTLYFDLNRYPYTVCVYTPLFHSLEAALTLAGLPAMMAGRLISFAAFLGIVALSWRITMHFTADRYCAWLAALLVASTSILESWGTTGQVDTLAVFWALAAFYAFSRRALLWAGIFAALAFFTKQTMLAAPAAIFVALWLERPKSALRFAALLGGAVAALALALDFATNGRVFADAVRGNLNPLALEKMKTQAMVLLYLSPLALVVAAGFKEAWSQARPLFLYLGFAAAVFALTAAKVGADTNYQIEFTIVLSLCACSALRAVDFFPLTFAGSKRWITMLQLPVAVYLVVNFWITKNALLTRVAVEESFRSEIAALAPYLAGGGRLLSADYNASVRLRGAMEVEPMIYMMLVRAGMVDPEPLRRDIAARAFSNIVLFEDVDHPEGVRDAETSTLTDAQLEAVRRNYSLAARIEGPYPSGVFVYKPKHD